MEDEAKTMEDETKTGNPIKVEKPRDGRRKETEEEDGRGRQKKERRRRGRQARRTSQVQREGRGWKGQRACGQDHGGLRPELGRWRGEGVWRSLGGGVGCARVCEWVRTCERVWVTERVSLGPDRCGKQPRMSFLALLGPHTHTFPFCIHEN